LKIIIKNRALAHPVIDAWTLCAFFRLNDMRMRMSAPLRLPVVAFPA